MTVLPNSYAAIQVSVIRCLRKELITLAFFCVVEPIR